MTVETNDTVERYTISGTGPYAYNFRIFDEDEIAVTAISTDDVPVALTIASHYTVSGVDDEDGGSITLIAASATAYAGYTLDIRSNTTQYQPTSIRNQGAFLPEIHEDAFDRSARQVQDLARKVRASIRYPDNEDTDAVATPVAERKGRYLFANAITGAFEWVTSIVTTALSQSIFNDYLGLSDPYKRTAAEIAAGVTPTNYAYPTHPYIDPHRYHSGTVGNATDDDAAVDQMILVIRQGGGTGIIPEVFSSVMAVPALGLSNSQSGRIIDLRAERPNSGNNSFGSVDDYIEGRDSSGNYASERRILGKQNPAFTAVSLSDGAANGYPRINFASSFLHKHEDQDQWQMLADPLFAGNYSWSLVYFAGSTGKTAMYVSIDTNSKPRFTFAQANLVAASGSVTGATNATPIVVTATAHGLDGVNQPVTIASVGGNTAANGDWEVTVLSANTFSLNGSVGNGAYTSGGTFSGQQGHSRATLNVPKVQGGTEAIYTEGQIASEVANGTAPITSLSQTPDVNLTACPKIVNINGTLQNNGSPGSGNTKTVVGNVTIEGGGTVVITLSGDAAFSGANTYKCAGGNLTGARAFQFTRTSGTSVTITGTASDSIDFQFEGF